MDEKTEEDQLKIWKYKDFKIFYYEFLNGGGTMLAGPIIDFIKNKFPEKKFNKLFEWCAGPGFIGFSFLKEGLCNSLCLADINPKALECINKTIAENNLIDNVTYYLSDNFDSIPCSEKFDLVLSNPPNFFNINPDHPLYTSFKDDLRPNDPGWQIHKKFYSSVKKFCNEDAILCISEVEPFKDMVYIPDTEKKPWEIRKKPAIDDFIRMIKSNGLKYIETTAYIKMPGNVDFYMMISKI